MWNDFYIWAGGQPVFMQIIIAFVLMFIGYVVVIAGLTIFEKVISK